MPGPLAGRKVAALVTHGFEQAELTEPRAALEAGGAMVHVVSPERAEVRGWNRTEWGDRLRVDRPLSEARAADYDALLLPGGVMNADRLRANPAAHEWVRHFFEAGKVIAVICHGPWTLIDAGVVRGLTMTSYPSIRTDMENAGAHWVDAEVVVDRHVVSSRRPADLPAFIRTFLDLLAAQTPVGDR
jgi:protease I